ncbi:mechanosensitive ion channel [Synechococcales cyanobacterium C]|uniref:Mechanosensitive ion channel n=1 Tax=Petrachloros mirabilis ULC683 TaxID=2781853 RepID=A0A8K1ZYR6_9CYAN|nr:mechanosensitive ion channel domain-containing protein [Petrachloros mirabilis]NCJ07634.1 mechanosensitive ion channel [Petrachloros mirabilis ULC683]
MTSYPVVAQESTSTAHIELDGYRLFQIWASDMFSADQRATDINRVLAEVVAAGEVREVSIAERSELPVIEIDGRYILTVTERDAPGGVNPRERSEFIRQRLEGAFARAQRQRQPQYVTQMVLVSAGLGGLAIAAHLLLGWLWQHKLRQLLPNSALDPESRKPLPGVALFLRTTLLLTRVGLWLFVLSTVLDFFPLTRVWRRRTIDLLSTSLASPIIPLADNTYSVVDLLVLLLMFLGLVSLARSVQGLLRNRILQVTGISRSAQSAIAMMVNYLLVFIGALVLLQIWGLDLSSLAIFASVLGVGIGLGLQGIAKEFVSGLVLIFERPIQIGHFIEVEGLKGTVERINVRSTEVRTLDQVSIIVPNSRFLESDVINWSYGNPMSRLQIPVGVAYGSNSSEVRAALIDAARSHPNVLAEPSPSVFFTDFGDSALNFTLLVWVNEPQRQPVIKSDLNFRIETVLRHRGIEIPFPQRDLHVRSGQLPLDLPPELTQSLVQLSQSLDAWLSQQTSSSDGRTTPTQLKSNLQDKPSPPESVRVIDPESENPASG